MDIGQEIGIARSTRYGYMYIQYGTVTKIWPWPYLRRS